MPEVTQLESVRAKVPSDLIRFGFGEGRKKHRPAELDYGDAGYRGQAEQDQGPEAAWPGLSPGPCPHFCPPAAGPVRHCFSLCRTCFWGKGRRRLPSCLPPFLQLGRSRGPGCCPGGTGAGGSRPAGPQDPRGHLFSSWGGGRRAGRWWQGWWMERERCAWMLGREREAWTGTRVAGSVHACVPAGGTARKHGGEEQTLELCRLLQRDIGQVTKFPMASVSGSVKWGCRGVPGSPLECLEQCLAQSGNGSSLPV